MARRTRTPAEAPADELEIDDEAQYHVTVKAVIVAGGVVQPGRAIIKGKHIKANRDDVDDISPA